MHELSSNSDLSDLSSHDESDFDSENERAKQPAKCTKKVSGKAQASSNKAPTTINSITPRAIEGIETYLI